MRRGLRRGIIWSAIVLVSLAAGLIGYVGLELDGWPEHHLYRPDFASSVSDKDWNGWNGKTHLDAVLTQALRKSIASNMQTASLVEILDREGFLARQENDGVCASDQSQLGLWLRGCKNYPADLANLRDARAGTMWYYWGGLPCNYSIRVFWQADDHGRMTIISASYGVGCL